MSLLSGVDGFELEPPELLRMSAQVRTVGVEVQGLAGLALHGVCIDRDPPHTADAWRRFATAWARGINEVGSSMTTLGAHVGAGSHVYVTTDASVVPAADTLCDR